MPGSDRIMAAGAALPADDTAKAPPRVQDGSQRSCWGDACVAVLVALAVTAIFARIHAFADLVVPLIIDEVPPASASSARRATAARPDAAARDAHRPSTAERPVLALAFLLRARRCVILLCVLLSPSAALAVAHDLYPRGEERYLSAARLVVEQGSRPHRTRGSCAPPSVCRLRRTDLRLRLTAQHGHFNYMDVLVEPEEVTPLQRGGKIYAAVSQPHCR